MITDGENYYPNKKTHKLFYIILGMGIAFILMTCGEVAYEAMTAFTTQEFIIFDLKTACWWVIGASIVGILTILIRKSIIILGNDKET